MQEYMFGSQYLEDKRDRKALYVKCYKDSHTGDWRFDRQYRHD